MKYTYIYFIKYICAFCSRNNRVALDMKKKSKLPERKMKCIKKHEVQRIHVHEETYVLNWFRYKNTSGASLLFVFFFRGFFVTEYMLYLPSSDEQRARASERGIFMRWEAFKMDFSIEFLRGRENTRRRNGGIILSLARSRSLRAKGSSTHEIRLYCTHRRTYSCVGHKCKCITYVRVQIRGRQVACISHLVGMTSYDARARPGVASDRRRPWSPGVPGTHRCVLPGQIIIYWTAIVFRARECYRRGLPRGRSETRRERS